MDLNVAPAIAELKQFTDSFSSYNTSLVNFLTNPSLSPPSCLDITFKTADTLATSNVMANSSANAISGYLVDASNHFGATQREISMRYKSKASYYDDSLVETQLEIQNLQNMNAEYSQAFRGLSTI